MEVWLTILFWIFEKWTIFVTYKLHSWKKVI
jgi:hypothetical protein